VVGRGVKIIQGNQRSLGRKRTHTLIGGENKWGKRGGTASQRGTKRAPTLDGQGAGSLRSGPPNRHTGRAFWEKEERGRRGKRFFRAGGTGEHSGKRGWGRSIPLESNGSEHQPTKDSKRKKEVPSKKPNEQNGELEVKRNVAEGGKRRTMRAGGGVTEAAWIVGPEDSREEDQILKKKKTNRE